MMPLILASASPRRKELLENLHLTFQVISSDVDETFNEKLTPSDVVMELALRKARDIRAKHGNSYVIGSDTVVVSNQQILGKPTDSDEAYKMLKMLSGQTHSVYTGVAIVAPEKLVNFYEKTDVEFWELTDEEIESYIRTGEPMDKAGAYGIQGLGSLLVKKIEGDYFSVVGLPLSRTIRELKQLGFELPY
ncbi:Maf family protein [Cytobacillus spongiae]|jgi:septum formation protein|uniref:Maf family protein n=1 Tax=Cytobacillus spongiae TaxID=2901381 RepID=UPI001F349102|nr:Maf family protein [Cytobacillus spongiae]UII55041.1 Maf family protein [Cytobacillus spongiae]